MKTIYAAIVAVVIIAGGLGGYFYYNNLQGTTGLTSGNISTGQTSGNLAISVADAPMNASVQAVNITFSSVAINSNSTGWKNYSVSNTTVDILGLTTTNASLLSNITLQNGTYTMIRLYITNVTVEINNLSENFSMASYYAFIDHPFTVSGNTTTNVIIDFHLSSDLNTNAKIFTPDVGYTQQ